MLDYEIFSNDVVMSANGCDPNYYTVCPPDAGTCYPNGVCNPDVNDCGPDYDTHCVPDCAPEE